MIRITMLTIVTIHDAIIGQNTTSSDLLADQIAKPKSARLITSAVQVKISLIIVLIVSLPI